MKTNADTGLGICLIVVFGLFLGFGGPAMIAKQITQSNPIIPPLIQTDIIIGKVTNLAHERHLLFDHYFTCIDQTYTFEVRLETYMKLSIGTSVRLDREFIDGEWKVVKLTVIE